MGNRLTRVQAADYLGCSISTFDRIVKRGYLKNTYFTLIGRKFFITEKLDEWILNGGTEKINAKE